MDMGEKPNKKSTNAHKINNKISIDKKFNISKNYEAEIQFLLNPPCGRGLTAIELLNLNEDDRIFYRKEFKKNFQGTNEDPNDSELLELEKYQLELEKIQLVEIERKKKQELENYRTRINWLKAKYGSEKSPEELFQLEKIDFDKKIQDVIEPIYQKNNSIHELLLELEKREGKQVIRDELGPKFEKIKSVRQLLVLEYEHYIRSKLEPKFGKGKSINNLILSEYKNSLIEKEEKYLIEKFGPKYGFGLSIEELRILERLENIEFNDKNAVGGKIPKQLAEADYNKDKRTTESYSYRQKLWGSNH